MNKTNQMENFKETFSLDKETSGFINDKKWEMRESKSMLMRKVLKYFKENPEAFQKIINGEE